MPWKKMSKVISIETFLQFKILQITMIVVLNHCIQISPLILNKCNDFLPKAKGIQKIIQVYN